MYMYIYIFMYVCIYVCMYVLMDGWMDGWMYACMDRCMYICVHVHKYTVYLFLHRYFREVLIVKQIKSYFTLVLSIIIIRGYCYLLYYNISNNCLGC